MLRGCNGCHNLWPLYTPSMLSEATKRNESEAMSILEKTFDLFFLLAGAVAVVTFTL
jgi:hypothetical protein